MKAVSMPSGLELATASTDFKVDDGLSLGGQTNQALALFCECDD